jgi:hypothetical protein
LPFEDEKMAEATMMCVSTAAANEASSYRVKFDRENFKELVHIAKPKIIYRRKNMYFFAYDGFVMYCDQADSSDFSQRIIDATEFSNYQWTK